MCDSCSAVITVLDNLCPPSKLVSNSILYICGSCSTVTTGLLYLYPAVPVFVAVYYLGCFPSSRGPTLIMAAAGEPTFDGSSGRKMRCETGSSSSGTW